MNSPDEPSFNNTIDFNSIYFSIRRRWKIFIVVFFIFFTGNILYTLYLWSFERVYKGGVQFLISDPFSKSKGGTSMGPSGGMDNKFFEDLARNNTSSNIPTLIELVKSNSILGEFSRTNGYNYARLKENITITPKGADSGGGGLAAMRGGGGEAGILEISLSWHNPSEGIAILSDFSSLLLKFAQDEKQQRLTNGLKFLDAQFPILEANVSNVQNQIYEFRRKNSLIEPVSAGNSLKRNEDKFRDEISQIEASRERLLQVRKEIVAGTISARGYKEAIQDGRSGAQFTISESDQSLLQELQKVESQLAAARSVYQPDSPIVAGLTKRLNAIKPLLLSNQLDAVDAALILLNGRFNNAINRVNKAEAKFLSTQALIRDYESLLEDLKVERMKLNGLINARDAFRLDIAQNSTSWRIINDPYMGSIPIYPNPPRNLIVGFVFSLISGAVAAYFFDARQGVFYESKNVTSSLGLPLLVHIPHFSTMYHSLVLNPFSTPDNLSDIASNLQVQYQEDFLRYSQVFRNLYASIRFVGSDKPLKSLLFTSSIPGEGKTMIASNFAISLSRLGYKVLLVDSDFRKPQLHRHFTLELKDGFSDLLEADTFDTKTFFKTPGNLTNLSILTAGLSSTDPSILLNSPRFSRVFSDLSGSYEFDYILFDSPPLLAFSDASLISDYCSSTIFVVSLRNVKTNLPLDALNKVPSKDSILGVVSNSIKPDFPSSDNQSSYYSTYYGIGNDTADVDDDSSPQSLPVLNPVTYRRQFSSFLFQEIPLFFKSSLKYVINWFTN